MKDRPLSYWVAVARMGFENDLHRLVEELNISRGELAKRLGSSAAYVSKFLNGAEGNPQLETMAKWARALGAIVQIRLVKEGKEVVRVLDYEAAGALDDKRASEEKAQATPAGARVLNFRAAAPEIYRALHSGSTSTSAGTKNYG